MSDQLYCPECADKWSGAYNTDHRCVTCGSPLKAGTADGELERVRAERDALAAHVGSMTLLMNRFFLCDDYSANGEGEGTTDGILVPIDLVEEFAELSATAPSTFLARLKAQLQAEILHKACNEGKWGCELRHMAFALERQASGGDS